jgi:hypothetical protein
MGNDQSRADTFAALCILLCQLGNQTVFRHRAVQGEQAYHLHPVPAPRYFVGTASYMLVGAGEGQRGGMTVIVFLD